MKPEIIDFLIEEAAQTGVSAVEVLRKYRQRQLDDMEQGRFDLRNDALYILQEAAQEDIDVWEDVVSEAIAEGASMEDFEAKPPYPNRIVLIDFVGFQTGFKGTHQELCAWVACEDGSEQYVVWIGDMDSEYDSIDAELTWVKQPAPVF